MKIHFSYKHDFFKPVLAASLAAHLAAFAGAGLMDLKPEFSVDQGVSTIAVRIVPDIQKPKAEPEKVLTAIQPAEPLPQVEEKKEELEEPKPEEAPVETEARAIRENDPLYLRNPAPAYPRYARERGWEGLVVLRVHVEDSGKVSQVIVESSSGFTILDDSAVQTIWKWQFSPAHVGSVRFASWVKIPVRFVLTKD